MTCSNAVGMSMKRICRPFHEQTVRDIFSVAVQLQARSRVRLRVSQKSLLGYKVNGSLGQRDWRTPQGLFSFAAFSTDIHKTAFYK